MADLPRLCQVARGIALSVWHDDEAEAAAYLTLAELLVAHPEPAEGLVVTVVRRRTRDALRSWRGRMSANHDLRPPPAEVKDWHLGAAPDPDLSLVETLDRAGWAFPQMSDQERRVVTLRAQGMLQREVAVLLGVSVPRVCQIERRMQRRLSRREAADA